MLAAGMLRGIRAISLLVLLVPLINYAHSSPLQYLPSIPGYIPVYIRYGDEPLVGINPALAEAFGETSNSAKSLQKIDHTLSHDSDNFKDDDINVLLEESNREHPYPLHVREAEPNFATVNSNEPNKPKLLTIYELPDDRDIGRDDRPRRRFRGRSRMKNWKPPAPKSSPLSDSEKEELKKLAMEVEKEETKPNELYGPHSKSPSNRSHNRHRAHNFIAPIKVQDPLNDPLTNLPEVSKVSGVSKFSNDYNDNDYNIAETGKWGLPIKGQRPETMFANVDKLLPVDLPDEGKASEGATPEADKEKLPDKQADLSETPQVMDLSEPTDYDIPPPKAGKKEPLIKVQHPAIVLSNVDKLSPIDLPDENETKKDNKAKDCY